MERFGLVVGPATGDHRVDHRRELGRGGRDALGLAQPALHPPAELAQPAFGPLQAESRQPQGRGHAVGGLARRAAQDPPAADPVARTHPEPGAEPVRAGKRPEQVVARPDLEWFGGRAVGVKKF